MIRFLFLLLPLLFWQTNLVAQKSKKKKRFELSIVDSMSLSPSANLMFYWWDPFHLHSNKKIFTPFNVDQSTFANQKPPYTYKFKLKHGLQQFSILSCFNDSIHFKLNLEKDTTLYFQHLVKDFYHLVDSSQSLLNNLKSQDQLTVYLARIFPSKFHALRLDFHLDEDLNIVIDLINREAVKLKTLDQQLFRTELETIETHARALEQADPQYGYFVVLRKNQEVIEYRGKTGGGKINSIIIKLEKLLSVKN